MRRMAWSWREYMETPESIRDEAVAAMLEEDAELERIRQMG